MAGTLARRSLHTLVIVLAVALVVGTVSAPVALVAAQEDTTTGISIRGEPGLSVSAPAPTLAPGQTTTLTLQVTNDGALDWGGPDQRDAVVTARDVRVEASAEDAPFDVESDVVALGAVGEAKPREVDVAVTVPEDAEPGTYDVEVEVSYSHVAQYWTSGTTQYSQEHSHTVEETIEVDVEDTARFELSNVSTDALVGGDGTLVATLENVGSERADDVRLALESSSPGVALAGAPADERYVGSLDPGEMTTVSYDLTVRPDVGVREYSVGGTVRYADADGFTRHDPDLAAGFRPIAEQEFSIADTSGDLRAGEERPLSITVRNDGPRTVVDPVVALDFKNPNVYLDSPQQAIDDLEPNETATVTYSVDVSASAQESRQGATVTVAYSDLEGDRLRSDPLPASASIGAERDQFDVQVVNGTVTAGGTDTVELTVTNTGDRPISEIEAKTYLDDPLDSTDDEAMIAALEPGESETVRFDVSAADSAPAKTYGLSVDFHYERHDGDAELSRTYAVPIDVESAPETDRPAWLPALAVILTIGVLVLFWQRDRLLNLVR